MKNNRRDFIKTGALLGTTLIATSAFGLTTKSTKSEKDEIHKISDNSNKRKLGSGKQRIEVSALGLGCMGMSYHRSFVPDRKAMIALIRKAPELGVNFFDTAEAYGPFSNEELVGEALAPFRKEVIVVTKFGFKEGKPSLGLDSRPERIRKVVEHS
jgi:aryl-alcohol dehydrogenase-like predicted oxidoreductase